MSPSRPAGPATSTPRSATTRRPRSSGRPTWAPVSRPADSPHAGGVPTLVLEVDPDLRFLLPLGHRVGRLPVRAEPTDTVEPVVRPQSAPTDPPRFLLDVHLG